MYRPARGLTCLGFHLRKPLKPLHQPRYHLRPRQSRLYRRLARVAIAHLGCTPTFAGHLLEGAESPDDAAPAAADPGDDADRVYRRVAPLLGTQGDEASAAPRTGAPPAADVPQPRVIEVRECPPNEGQRATIPPIAGVVSRRPAPPQGPPFATWDPASTDELLGAVRTSIGGLLPGARGFVQLDGVVNVADQPDAVAVDGSGRAVALLVADGSQPEALRRAVTAHAWLTAYARLLAQAFPQAGLDPAAHGPHSIVLVPEGATDGLEPLCPPHVGLAAYTPVTCGEVRGLLFRQVLRPVHAAPRAAEARSAAAPPATPAVVPHGAAATLDDIEPAGTSPDDDLSADEMNDLKGAFEIDELT